MENCMNTATISEKGQITLPAALRKRLNLQVGGQLEILETTSGILLKPLLNDVQAAFGLIKPTRGVSLEKAKAIVKARRARA
jgi:AbrB family looped-hinge helix DNA binding protein